MKVSTHIRELDGIRGIAILMVIVWHYFTCQIKGVSTTPTVAYFRDLTQMMWSGVDLFFILSGFLIGGIIIDNHQKSRYLQTFWIRRCCRILPVLGLLLVTVAVLKLTLDPYRYDWLFDNLMPWWSYGTFTQNIFMGLRESFGGHALGITWSLAIEEQFYLFAPVLMLLLKKKMWARALFPLIILAVALRHFYPGFHTHVNTIFRMDALLSGAGLAVLYRNQSFMDCIKPYRLWLALGLIGLVIIGNNTFVKELPETMEFTWNTLVYAWLILLVLLYQNTRITSVLRSPLLCFWGGISYGLYMYHQLISGLLHGWLMDGRLPLLRSSQEVYVTLLAFVVSTTAAWLSLRYYEKPFLRIGKRFSYGSDKRA